MTHYLYREGSLKVSFQINKEKCGLMYYFYSGDNSRKISVVVLINMESLTTVCLKVEVTFKIPPLLPKVISDNKILVEV